MKITSLHLKNFKRFTDLSIQSIPETTKLVLLIGANGSGKSSVFDAFAFAKGAYGTKTDQKPLDIIDYFSKKKNSLFLLNIQFDKNKFFRVENDNISTVESANQSFYYRTSFRQLSRLTRTTLGEAAGRNIIENDSDRPQHFIDRDNRFENDVERITEEILKDVFLLTSSNVDIRQKYIAPINNALESIFGNLSSTRLELIEIIPPLEGKVAQITFKKGSSEIHYNLLSAGEKEVFNLLLNLLSRREQYQDTIYVFDEIDLHLNTQLQFRLLKEITDNWIPENCQLWTASHSLGFIEYAKQSEQAVIIDFDSYDFDQPRTLVPEPKENPDVYEIAVGKEFLPSLFRHLKIVFVENKDSIFYANAEIDKTVFVPENNRNNVFHKVRTTEFSGIVDRDFLSDGDIELIEKSYLKLHVLNYYSVENYLYHPDNLEEYYHSADSFFDKEEYTASITTEKEKVKDAIIPSLSMKRTEYPYFKEPGYDKKPQLQNRFKNEEANSVESGIIASYLNSNIFEIYYKVLPMKKYCTHLPQRQNVSKVDLSRTKWFQKQIEKLMEATLNTFS